MRTASRMRLQDDVLAVLRDAILGGQFAPGERLSEVALADQLEVSRGPVRVALAQLAHEGIVTIEPHKGASVPLMSREDVEEIYTLRLALETLAARRAVHRSEAADHEALSAAMTVIRDALASGDRRAIADADLQFHDAFYQAAHHRRLHASWRSIRSQVSLLLYSRNTVAVTTKEVIVDEHDHLARLLRERDEESLVSAVTEHIKGSYERLLERYDR